MKLPNGLTIRAQSDPNTNFWIRIPSSLGARVKRTRKRLRKYGLVLRLHAELAEAICAHLDEFDAHCDQLDKESVETK